MNEKKVALGKIDNWLQLLYENHRIQFWLLVLAISVLIFLPLSYLLDWSAGLQF